MAVEVEMDSKGRVLLPATVRREVKARRFSVDVKGGRILLEPLPDPENVRGKYRKLLKVSMEELEESQEKFLTSGRR
jgi:bifunctional DNA-binding transcriptional regulator/antitoxin component of YhaV-PrlF toxin-antitoxin module